MTDLITKAENIPWFTNVPDAIWENWPGPEEKEVERISKLTQEIIDNLEERGLDSEPKISNSAFEIMQILSDKSLLNINDDIYESRYFAGWIGSWLLSASVIYETNNVSFPKWAKEMLLQYRNGNWPWGIDENKRILVN